MGVRHHELDLGPYNRGRNVASDRRSCTAHCLPARAFYAGASYPVLPLRSNLPVKSLQRMRVESAIPDQFDRQRGESLARYLLHRRGYRGSECRRWPALPGRMGCALQCEPDLPKDD